MASLKGTIARKDKEIERLQLLKDMGNQYLHTKEGYNRSSLRQSSSSPGLALLSPATRHSRKLSGRKAAVSSKRANSDPGNSSDHSEASSQQSMDDFRHQKKNLGLRRLSTGDLGQSFPADIELLGFGDADSDERLSDISDGVLSMGAETEGSMNSIVEFSLFPEQCTSTGTKKEK